MDPITWGELKAQPRFMPIGRPDDPKALASGYRSNDPSNWTPFARVRTPMVGINFQPQDIVALDLDFKPDLVSDAQTEQDCRSRLRAVAAEFPLCQKEVSHSGHGVHIFGQPDDLLRSWLTRQDKARIPVVLARSAPDSNGRRKVACAVEVFGGGPAYIAMTSGWIGPAPEDSTYLRVITLDALFDALPELREQPNQPAFNDPPPFHDPDVDKARRILAAAPVPPDYDDWLKAASAFANSGVPLEEIDAWSQGGTSYTKGEVFKRAGKFLRSPGIGWLVSWAKALGIDFRPPREARPRRANRVDIMAAPAAPMVDAVYPFGGIADFLAEYPEATFCHADQLLHLRANGCHGAICQTA